MKKIVIVFILINMSIPVISQEQKEDIYVFSFNSKSPAMFSITFVIVDKEIDSVKTVNFDVVFSYRKKVIKQIHKNNFAFERVYGYEKLENGNIWVKKGNEVRRIADVDYFTTENFRKTTRYAAFKKYLPELLELDNYDLLLYLDSNFTKYYGAEEYKHAPLLKVQRE